MYQVPSSTTTTQKSTSFTKTAFLLMPTLLAGTGTAYGLENFDEWRTYLQPRVSFELDDTREVTKEIIKPDVRGVTEHLSNIRTNLNLTVSDLANVLDISRQAVYKWITGDSSPDADNSERIVALSKIADVLLGANVPKADALLKMKAFSGKSLLDLLKSEKNCDQYLEALIVESRKMEDAYSQSGLVASKSKPNNNWLSSISIPGNISEQS